MDRSFLSDKAVVEASRDYVCARLISFEDVGEDKLMRKLWRGQANTLFTLMDPTGNRRLSRVGRSPSGVFGDAATMAKEMKAIAKRYPAKKRVDGKLALPLLEDVRIALNVTECDAQQLVILRGDAKKTAAMEKELAKLAWSDECIGRFLYARGDDNTDWSVFDGIKKVPDDGMLIVRSEKYGLSGKVVASLPAKAKAKDIEKVMQEAAASHTPKAVDTRRTRRDGRRNGVKWKAELPLPKKR